MFRVIVIEDEPNMRDMLRIHLSSAGFKVEVFDSATAGAFAILDNPPDAVVLDLVLPDLGGLEVLRELKSGEATRNVPVIVLTSLTRDETYMEAAQLGVDAFLTKPLTREELIRTVMGQIAKRISASPKDRS